MLQLQWVVHFARVGRSIAGHAVVAGGLVRRLRGRDGPTIHVLFPVGVWEA